MKKKDIIWILFDLPLQKILGTPNINLRRSYKFINILITNMNFKLTIKNSCVFFSLSHMILKKNL